MLNRRDAIARIRRAIGEPSYLVPTDGVASRYRDRLSELATWMATPDFDGEVARRRVQDWRERGLLDDEHTWSALAVIYTHPRVRNFREAARCIALQESAAMAASGEHLAAALGSVERHRGVLAWSMGHVEVALDCFVAALERERTAENLGNVMAALVRLDELEQAQELLDDARRGFPAALVEDLERRVASDEDLAPLRGIAH